MSRFQHARSFGSCTVYADEAFRAACAVGDWERAEKAHRVVRMIAERMNPHYARLLRAKKAAAKVRESGK